MTTRKAKSGHQRIARVVVECSVNGNVTDKQFKREVEVALKQGTSWKVNTGMNSHGKSVRGIHWSYFRVKQFNRVVQALKLKWKNQLHPLDSSN